MSKRIYYNVPCTLFRNYLKNDFCREQVLFDVLTYAVYSEYLRLQDEVFDEAEGFDMACKNMGCKNRSMEQVLTDGKSLFESGKGEAFVSLDSDKYWKQVNEDMTHEERAMFLAWMALKSIQGNKPFAKTCNAMWLSRMDGYSRMRKPSFRAKNTFSEPVEKYNSKYKCSRLRALLFKYYQVSSDADGVRGFYFSTSMDMNRFVATLKAEPKTDVISEFKAAKAAAKAALKGLTHDLAHDLTHDLTLK